MQNSILAGIAPAIMLSSFLLIGCSAGEEELLAEEEQSVTTNNSSQTGVAFTVAAIPQQAPQFSWGAGAAQNKRLDANNAGADNPDYKFRMGVAIANDSYDDPIVYPHQTGRAHHHLFLGNGYIDAHSTNSPDSTHDRTLNHDPRPIDWMSGNGVNRSGYWVPVMYDHGPDGQVGTAQAQQDDAPMVMGFNQIYYVKGTRGTESHDQTWENELQAMPLGLQIITAPSSYVFNCGYREHNPDNPQTYFEPVNGGAGNNWPDGFWPPGNGAYIPQCDTRVANNVTMRITFPDCWDGMNLTDQDHDNDPLTSTPNTPHDHMAYSDYQNGCPASHPVQLGTVQYNFYFPIKDPSYDTSLFYLSSDVSMHDGYAFKCNDGEHGCTNHGDWMNGWEPSVMAKMIDTTDGCLGSLTAHCASGQISSSEMLQQPASGVQNWQFGQLSFEYEFKHNKPMLMSEPETRSSFTLDGSGFPADYSVRWRATAVCENSDGSDYEREFTQADIETALTRDIGFPHTLGEYEFDWLKLGVANHGGRHAHESLNHNVPCTGFCFKTVVEADGQSVSTDCDALQ